MKLEELKIDIYADGADIPGMLEMYKKDYVKGFTTNPTLMKKAGIADYKEFAKVVTENIPDLPISFEIFSDDYEEMKKEALILSKYGENVYVKIPIMNSRGESSASLIRELSKEGVNLNVTAVFTSEQVESIIDLFCDNTKNIISVFAGRIADAGVDPENLMRKINTICHQREDIYTLWASCREVFNIIQADRCGTDIITVTNDILAKVNNLGKDLEKFSLETVQMFARDSKALGFKIM